MKLQVSFQDEGRGRGDDGEGRGRDHKPRNTSVHRYREKARKQILRWRLQKELPSSTPRHQPRENDVGFLTSRTRENTLVLFQAPKLLAISCSSCRLPYTRCDANIPVHSEKVVPPRYGECWQQPTGWCDRLRWHSFSHPTPLAATQRSPPSIAL